MICHIISHFKVQSAVTLTTCKRSCCSTISNSTMKYFFFACIKAMTSWYSYWVGKPIRNGIDLIVTSKVWWMYFDVSFYFLLEPSTLLWCATTTSMCNWNMCVFLNIYHLNFFKIEMEDRCANFMSILVMNNLTKRMIN